MEKIRKALDRTAGTMYYIDNVNDDVIDTEDKMGAVPRMEIWRVYNE